MLLIVTIYIEVTDLSASLSRCSLFFPPKLASQIETCLTVRQNTVWFLQKKKEYKDRTIIQYETEDEKMQKDFQIDITS